VVELRTVGRSALAVLAGLAGLAGGYVAVDAAGGPERRPVPVIDLDHLPPLDPAAGSTTTSQPAEVLTPPVLPAPAAPVPAPAPTPSPPPAPAPAPAPPGDDDDDGAGSPDDRDDDDGDDGDDGDDDD
jgi:hypothetical protein